MRSIEPRRSSLELLTPNVPLPQQGERVEDLPITSIIPNRRQVRKHFSEEKIRELADSIKEHGLMSPLIVRRIGKSPNFGLSEAAGEYELIAGERRLRALRHLDRTTVPAIVRTVEDSQMRLLALIENVQREDLGVLEKAASMLDLKGELGTLDKVAVSIHKSRSYAFMYARIGELGADFQAVITKNDLPIDQADALAGLVKEAEKSGDEKLEYAVKRALLDKPINAKSILTVRERYFGTKERKGVKKAGRGENHKTFWKTKREIGVQLRLPTTAAHDTAAKHQLVKEAKRFFEAIGAKKVEIAF